MLPKNKIKIKIAFHWAIQQKSLEFVVPPYKIENILTDIGTIQQKIKDKIKYNLFFDSSSIGRENPIWATKTIDVAIARTLRSEKVLRSAWILQKKESTSVLGNRYEPL